MPNLLASEKSPYLLQHATNPVDWYPWGDAAFEKARAEQKPIFVSVGYSTCHWCHVMAHESFEDEAIARLLNTGFVPIKVDREERPDVDRVYMTFVQATTGSGGWPMSVWLTPDLQPFYGGTYFPPTARWGRPGFTEILQEIARLWRDDREKVRQSAAQVTAQLKQVAAAARDAAPAAFRADEAVLERAVSDFRQDFDSEHAGFGGAPKFPRPSELLFLLREHARLGSEGANVVIPGARGVAAPDARDMALATLRAMARGGIHDHVGGGFHRYSVDERWHLPHFEKMLYDQAQLALAYLEAWQVSGETDFARVAADILRYTSRDLGRPGGGFYSAEDADSIPTEEAGRPDAHPAEGAFYVWTDAEMREVLGEEADLVRLRFGVKPGGNVASDPQGEFHDKNVLYVARSVDEIAAATGRPAARVDTRLAAAVSRLFDARARRPRPGRDDKVLVAWNGLMIAAFARASRVLPSALDAEPPISDLGPRTSDLGPRVSDAGPRTPHSGRWLQPARDAARFIETTMWDPASGRLLRRSRDGEAAIDAYADDFACLVFGLLELFQADGDSHWLEWALALQRRQDELFGDDRAGGWFSTTGEDASVLLRLKEDYDGAEPAASSVSAWNLLVLDELIGEGQFRARLERTFAAFERQLVQMPRSMPMMLAALSTWVAARQQIVIVGPEGRDDVMRLRAALASRYLPFAVMVPVSPGQEPALARLLPAIGAMTMREGRATAYVCRDFACNRPTTDSAEMLGQLEAPG